MTVVKMVYPTEQSTLRWALLFIWKNVIGIQTPLMFDHLFYFLPSQLLSVTISVSLWMDTMAIHRNMLWRQFKTTKGKWDSQKSLGTRSRHPNNKRRTIYNALTCLHYMPSSEGHVKSTGICDHRIVIQEVTCTWRDFLLFARAGTGKRGVAVTVLREYLSTPFLEESMVLK